ncbi:response regulator transcription factor (plasmid) [Pantoea dispersa]|uniref:response regulator transcription factor n=1 Tax=Pantoea dispersa TaxID=59814 RepID=UPI001CA77274|nr:response regulator transcription factor [Pantoea dispersa]QZY92924.1 response regulator transcription factor [Pantoea dispersa]
MSRHHFRKVSVALLDDHDLVLRGLRDLLEENALFNVVGTYSSGRELIVRLRDAPADVLVIDYELSPADVDGLDLIKSLTRHYPKVAILVVSAHYNPATVALALRGGAKGFLGKNRPAQEIHRAIITVSRGEVYLETEMRFRLADQQQHGELLLSGQLSEARINSALSLSSLTPKEQEVVRCFLSGMTVTEIAEKFSRSLKTVSGQKQSAIRKLGLKADHELFIIKDVLLKQPAS